MAILIVEDGPLSARVLEIKFQRAGLEVVTAENGRRALELLEQSPDIELVISDVMMPEMDGLDLVKAMRERPELRDLPVILTTAMADADTVKRAAALGVRHFMVKPVNAPELVERARELLRGRRPTLGASAAVMSRLAIDRQAYDEVVARFASAVAGGIELLEQGLAAGTDGAKLKEAIAGLGELADGAGLLGAERVAAALRQTRDAGSPDEAAGECRRLLRELKVLGRALAAVAPPPAEVEAAPEA
ncbi:MAG TPA: response regulator [Candidatus Binatia bacterium]|nr:response regulator [Candidatus Binatia bacterium]